MTHTIRLVDIHLRNSVRAVALELNLEHRAVKKMTQDLREVPGSLFKTIGCPKVTRTEEELAEVTKNLISDFFREYFIVITDYQR